MDYQSRYIAPVIAELHTKGLSRRAAQAFYAKHLRVQRRIENFFIPKIQSALVHQYKSFIDAIHTHGYSYAKTHIVSIVPIEPVMKVIKQLYHKAAVIQSNIVLDYLRKPVKKSLTLKRVGTGTPNASFSLSLDDLAPLIDQYFEIHLLNESALPITDTTRKYIVRHLVREVDGGKPLDEAIADFTELAISPSPREYYKAIARAKKIATTEGTRSLSFGGLIGAYMSGVDVDKVWVTSADERVRGYYDRSSRGVPFPHTKLDEVESDLFGSFYNNEHIKFPGDPDASEANTINCRCVLYFKEKEDPEERQPELGNFLLDFDAGKYIDQRLNGGI